MLYKLYQALTPPSMSPLAKLTTVLFKAFHAAIAPCFIEFARFMTPCLREFQALTAPSLSDVAKLITVFFKAFHIFEAMLFIACHTLLRSEERRVGKECRCYVWRWT